MPIDVYSAMLTETNTHWIECFSHTSGHYCLSPPLKCWLKLTRFQAIVSVARVFIDETYSTPMCWLNSKCQLMYIQPCLVKQTRFQAIVSLARVVIIASLHHSSADWNEYALNRVFQSHEWLLLISFCHSSADWFGSAKSVAGWILNAIWCIFGHA